ncbi:Mediator of RNA polymerase II transcription subunit 28 [Cryptotermes secundus]|uniref:Mediator of RNA polymerase II transcription subunit 28 n=2 Tax=Cryptotermes secundus TaxID=105785 RepID=A0A2J7PL72_9NEOP|nr:mediator of RNA polymerase II transcription subunit 28 [Cryptotermes secundus]PNF17081.1 Mediator of RNA polymerase II transcription subunit 28 [Cryptotermes secundus]
MAATTNGNGNLVDEFEEAFQSCLSVLTKEEVLPTMEKDEIRVEVDHTILRFIDLARQMEAFFLQKRFLLSALKPELVVKEDTNELRQELVRKEELIKRHYEKIAVWQNLFADLQGWAKSPAQGPASSGLPNGNSGPQPPAPPTGAPPQPNMSSNMQQQLQQQQLQQQQIQQQQQQQLQQQIQQQQMQQQIQQQQMQQQGPPGISVASGSGGPGPMVSPQQAMFLQQSAGPRGAPGFPTQGPGGVLQGPLAFLEKTTSNIGMPEGRR